MKSPHFSFSARHVFGAATVTSLFWLLGAPGIQAQDRLVFRDNTVVNGKVIGMNNGAVVVNVATSSGTGQMSYNLNLLSRLDVPPPAGYQTGMAAYQAGNWDKALADLKPLSEQFHALSTDWARQTASVLGDIYLEKNDVPRAEAALNDYRRFYPGGGGDALRLSVGQARIAYAKHNAPQARVQLQAITQAAMKNPALVTRLDGGAYGQAFYLLGQIDEKDGKFQDALENYLRTVTLFYQDSAVTAKAQQSADALRAGHKDVTAP